MAKYPTRRDQSCRGSFTYYGSKHDGHLYFDCIIPQTSHFFVDATITAFFNRSMIAPNSG